MPMKMKNMKGIDLFCASPASTAICSSTDQRSMVRNGTKPLHRLNTYLGDHYKNVTNNIYNHSPRVSCSNISQLPLTPRPSSYRERTRKLGSLNHYDHVSRRKSSADVSDLRYEKISCIRSSSSNNNNNNNNSNSSRYLLGDSPFLDSLSSETDENTAKSYLALVPSTPVVRSEERESRKSRSHTTGRLGSLMDAEKVKINNKKTTSLALVNVNPSDQRGIKPKQPGNAITKYSPKTDQRQCRNDSLLLKSSSASAQSRDQVVVLRVSLHCKGCEGKLRKHLSKMEGVTSFSIDFETKKVTVIGNVTPLGVLTSISRVKNAQFWPSPASASSSTSSSSSSTSSTVDFSYYSCYKCITKGQLDAN